VSACDTPAKEGMEIETHTPEIEELRRELLQLVAHNYAGYSESAKNVYSDKEFHRLLKSMI
jgi:predicted molibdopterin-dependent oxidoreductase YjgC